MASNWQVGAEIQGRWKVHKILGGHGRSGMGVVYVVYDRKDRGVVALKTFQDEVFARDPAIAIRFTEEARLWLHLGLHPNIVLVHSVKKIEGKPFVCMEYVSGGDLGKWIGHARLTENLIQILRFSVHICDGMLHAFSKGLKAHRDLKPENCLIAEYNVLMVTDLGLARAATSADKKGGRGGTAEYMAPEQWDDFEQADERADIYAFGATLYEMAVGRPPFGRRREKDGRDLERLHKREPPPLIKGSNAVFNPIVQKCLAKDPRGRFASFDILRQQLSELCQGIGGVALRPPIKMPKPDIGFLINKGVSFGNLGLHNEELRVYDEALEKDPDNARVLCNKGDALRSLGRYDEALACLDHALELDHELAEAWNNKGNVLDEMGRPREAVLCYDHAIQIDKYDAMSWYNKALALQTMGDRIDALACYEESLRLNPWNDQAWCNKGSVLKELGRREEALVCYDRALEINPRLEQALYNKATALDGMGKHEESLPFFDRAIAENPNDHLNWYGKGTALMKLRRFEESLECFNRAIAFNPRFEKALVNKGAALLALRQYDDAIVWSDRALALNPGNGGNWFNRAEAMAAVGREREARECYEKAGRLGYPLAAAALKQRLHERAGSASLKDNARTSTSIHPDTTQPDVAQEHGSLGNMLMSKGQLDEAILEFRRVLRMVPSNSKVHNDLGVALAMKGDIPEAVREFEESLKLDPNNAEAHVNLGLAHDLLGQPDQAVRDWRTALRLKPDYVEAYLNIGSLFIRQRKYAEAIEVFEQAITIKEDYFQAYFNLGIALIQQGRREDAITALERFLKCVPATQQSQIQQVREMLDLIR